MPKNSVSLAEVEQATGLSREVLRKWEQRYHFPKPFKGARGERLYLPREVERLRLLSQLVNQGARVGRLMPLSMEALQRHLTGAPTTPDPLRIQRAVPELLRSLASDADPVAPHEFLRSVLRRKGLSDFIEYCVPVFSRAVGVAWQAGELGVHGEHRYSEALRQVLTQGLPIVVGDTTRARVLLTTPPGELHNLALLSLHTALALQGAACFNLGAQMPVRDVAQAVREWRIDVVAISVSCHFRVRPLRSYVATLLDALPKACQIWLGGDGAACMAALADQRLRVYGSVTRAAVDWTSL